VSRQHALCECRRPTVESSFAGGKNGPFWDDDQDNSKWTLTLARCECVSCGATWEIGIWWWNRRKWLRRIADSEARRNFYYSKFAHPLEEAKQESYKHPLTVMIQ
jgi:hypothetical protein